MWQPCHCLDTRKYSNTRSDGMWQLCHCLDTRKYSNIRSDEIWQSLFGHSKIQHCTDIKLQALVYDTLQLLPYLVTS